jgi:indolepyruvate ferredoxin oxidoreductase
MKTIQEVVESSATCHDRPRPREDRDARGLPDAARRPAHPLARRALEQEARLLDYKWYAALAYVRANKLNYNVIEGRTTASASSPAARPTTTRARRWSTWGWTTTPAASWASACTRSTWCGRWRPPSRATSPQGLQEILVVEEKRQVIEYQLKEELYNWRADVRPNVLGKFDDEGEGHPGGEWSMPNPSQTLAAARQGRPHAGLIARPLPSG